MIEFCLSELGLIKITSSKNTRRRALGSTACKCSPLLLWRKDGYAIDGS
jgi:hypothetical protein